MQERFPIFSDPLTHIARHRPDHPVLYFAPAVLQATARAFVEAFPGQVTYAVKANPRAEVLSNLVTAGITGFDVASPAEMAAVRAVCPDAVLHYNNPVRSDDEIAAGIAAGVTSWSVDHGDGLAQLAGLPRGTEIAVRFALPVTGAVYDFGSKFGATPDAAAGLLAQVAARGFSPALTFHPGTQCTDPAAWAGYIATAADIARRAGVRLQRLNVGGGFPAERGRGRPALAVICAAIDHAAAAAFGDARPALVCEPGRAMVAGCATLATRIKARRGDVVYLNDGVYGGLTELRDLGLTDLVRVVTPRGRAVAGPAGGVTAFGPTCDSLDRLPDGLHLPAGAAPGDYVLFGGMGAYSVALSTGFNGYGPAVVETVAELTGHAAEDR